MEEYGAAKQMIYRNQSVERGDWAVFNADHPVVREWAQKAPAGVGWFGVEGDVKRPGVFLVDDKLVWYPPDGERVVLGGAEMVRVPGLHNLRTRRVLRLCRCWPERRWRL